MKIEKHLKRIEVNLAIIDKAKKEITKLNKQIHTIQDECTHDYLIEGNYRTCNICNHIDIVIRRKRKAKSKDEELF